MQRKSQTQDRGWGWMVVTGCAIVQIITIGFFHAIGILYVEMMNIFSVQSSEISSIGALQTGFFYFTAPAITAYTDRFSPRIVAIAGSLICCAALMASAWIDNLFILYLTLGILPGVGLSMGNLTTYLIINEYFDQKRSIALGIAAGSAAIGISTFGPFTHFLAEIYSFKGALLLLSGVALNYSVGGALFYPSKESEVTRPDCLKSLRAIFDFSLLLEVDFVMFLLSNICTSIGYWIPLAFLPDLTTNLGFSLNDVSSLMVAYGISSLVGRVISAFSSQRYPRTAPSLYALWVYSAGISTILLPYYTNLGQLYVFVVLFGFSTGGLQCITLVLTVELFEAERLSRSLGLVYVSQGIGCLVGGPLSTKLADLMSWDDFLYYFSGGAYVMSGVLLLPLIMQNLFCKDKYNVQENVIPKIQEDNRNSSVVSLISLSVENPTY